MTLSEFLVDSRLRTGDQVRESTHYEYGSAMEQFIKVVGNIDFQKVRLSHGELFRQTCLDKGNTAATVGKKVRSLKRLFQLGVRRGQLQENPLKYLDEPKWSKRKIEIYKPGEIERILKAARHHREPLRWDLLIYTALVTALRRGELLNATWRDVDFEAKTIDVSPKQSTPETWRWLIKDTDRRTLPLTDELVAMLAAHQVSQPSGYPYVFVPVRRYDHIQKLRRQGRWTLVDSRLKVVNNFKPNFEKTLRRASVRIRRFHDLRNTAITSWFRNGMSEYDVMKLAGHADFKTTHKFYLAIADDLIDRAREASVAGVCQNLAHTWQAP
jgi:integrase